MEKTISYSDLVKSSSRSLDMQAVIKTAIQNKLQAASDPLCAPSEDIEAALLGLKTELTAAINKAIIDSNNADPHPKWPTINDFSKWGLFIIKETIFAFYEVYNFMAYNGDVHGMGFVFSKTSDDPNEIFKPFVDVLRTYAGAWLIPGTYKPVEKLTVDFLADTRVTVYINDGNHDPEDKLMSIPAANGVVIRERTGKVREVISYREAKERGLYYNIIFPWRYLGDSNPIPEIPDDMTSDGYWRPTDWIDEVFAGDKDKIDSFYNMVLGNASIYDTEHWKGCFILRDEQNGNTGKSTIIELLRHMAGQEHVANLSIDALSNADNFTCEPLASYDKSLIAYDENEPDKYLEKVEALKCACTADPFTINRKGLPVISYVHRGRVVQGYNGIIKSKDNTDSFYRRLMVIEFSVKFGKDKAENRKIKSEWIGKQEVMDFFGTEAINRNILLFPDTERQQAIIDEMKTQNDKVKRFFEEIVSGMLQNHFTLSQLYPVYVRFCKETGGFDTSDDKFMTKAKLYLSKEDSEWTYTPRAGYPNSPGSASLSSHHIPFNKMVSFNSADVVHKDYSTASKKMGFLADDPVFDILFYMVKTDARSDQARKITKAFNDIYTGDGKKSDKIYYRKPDAERQNLLKIAAYQMDFDPEEKTPAEIITLLDTEDPFEKYLLEKLEKLGA